MDVIQKVQNKTETKEQKDRKSVLGLAPEGVVRSSSPAVAAPENDTVFITVHWDVGTDIELELDFGDGTALYSWNWQVRVCL